MTVSFEGRSFGNLVKFKVTFRGPHFNRRHVCHLRPRFEVSEIETFGGLKCSPYELLISRKKGHKSIVLRLCLSSMISEAWKVLGRVLMLRLITIFRSAFCLDVTTSYSLQEWESEWICALEQGCRIYQCFFHIVCLQLDHLLKNPLNQLVYYRQFRTRQALMVWDC